MGDIGLGWGALFIRMDIGFQFFSWIQGVPRNKRPNREALLRPMQTIECLAVPISLPVLIARARRGETTQWWRGSAPCKPTFIPTRATAATSSLERLSSQVGSELPHQR